jgi:hypothetical protein
MTQVKLRFDTEWIVSERYGNVPLGVIRLLADVAFRLPTGESTEIYEAILDTGAFVSVLPKYLWKQVKREIWVENTFFSGIKPRKACRVQASFGTVSGYLCDETGNRTRDYEFPAFLAKTDRVPLIVGFAGLLEKLAVYEVNC